MDEFKFGITCFGIGTLIVLFIIFGINNENTKIHEDDLTITEWISPDGVHYWYQYGGYGRMLAPRYDNNGNLVIDAEGE